METLGAFFWAVGAHGHRYCHVVLGCHPDDLGHSRGHRRFSAVSTAADYTAEEGAAVLVGVALGPPAYRWSLRFSLSRRCWRTVRAEAVVSSGLPAVL